MSLERTVEEKSCVHKTVTPSESLIKEMSMDESAEVQVKVVEQTVGCNKCNPSTIPLIEFDE